MADTSQPESRENSGDLVLASAQKLLIWAILTSIVGLLFWWLLLIVIPFQLYCVFRLARASGMSRVTSLFYLVMMFIPLLSLICLLILNSKATRTLKAAGIQVGLMGAKTPSTQLSIGLRVCVVLVVLVVAGAVIHDISILAAHPMISWGPLTSIYQVLQPPLSFGNYTVLVIPPPYTWVESARPDLLTFDAYGNRRNQAEKSPCTSVKVFLDHLVINGRYFGRLSDGDAIVIHAFSNRVFVNDIVVQEQELPPGFDDVMRTAD